MNITSKLMLGYASIDALVLAVGLLGWHATRNVHERYDAVIDKTWPTLLAVQEVRFFGLRVVATSNELVLLHAQAGAELNRDAEARHEMRVLEEQALQPFEQALDRYAHLVNTNFPGEKLLLEKISRQADYLRALSAKLLAIHPRDASFARTSELRKEFEAAEAEFLQVINDGIAEELARMDENHEAVDGEIKQFLLIAALVSLSSFVVALISGAVVARGLTGPLRKISATAERMGRGDLSARTEVHTHDEVGTLARALNNMADSLSRTTVSKDYVENVLGSVADALIVIDAQGRVVRANSVAAALLGYAAEEDLHGMPLEASYAGPSLHPEATEEAELPSRLETTLKHRNGHPIAVSLSASRLRDSAGEYLGSVLVAQDVMERRRAQETLRRKNEELERFTKEFEQFAYVVSHDLKAPLRAIANLSRWIEEDLGSEVSSDTRKQMDLLRGRVQRMENLINGILEYSRIGRAAVDIEKFDTADLVRQVVESLPVPDGYTIAVASDMPVLLTPRSRLGKVFSHLLSNAIRYRAAGNGHAWVSVRDAGAYYEFAVQDDGRGIDPQYHQKVFVIFQTLVALDKAESTGIGLTLVKKIVGEQGGTVSLESEEGKGATFRFTWPKVVAAQEEKAA